MSPLYGIKTSRLPAQLSLPTECKWSVFFIVFALHNSVIFWWFCVCHLLVTYTNVAKQWVSLWHFHTCLSWALPYSPPHYSLLFPVPMTANIFHLPELSTSTYMCVHVCLCVCVCAHKNMGLHPWSFHLNGYAPVSLCIWHGCVFSRENNQEVTENPDTTELVYVSVEVKRGVRICPEWDAEVSEGGGQDRRGEHKGSYAGTSRLWGHQQKALQ